MKTLLLSCAAIFTLIASVRTLTCYTCDASILGYCAIPQQISCSTSQTSCYTGTVSLSGIAEELHSRGCIVPSDCKNSSSSVFGDSNIVLTQTTYCCSTDLCNAAGPGRSPLALSTALGALLLALGAHFSL